MEAHEDVIGATAAGKVRGRRSDGVASFRGVPFAAPPFGPNRFLAPEPVVPWDGTRDALLPGASAPQPHRQFTLIPEPVHDGDDCLQLDVFTPDMGATGLPVLVWIHGGGFVAGCNASPWYDGSSFARRGVVVVNISYRLGIEGFLAIEGAPLNRGVLDWLAALAWVHDNIAGFGGDPGKVTIAGQSAGGVACGTLLAMEQARGLFRRAILMSGAGQDQSSLDGARRQAEVMAELTGVPSTIEALSAVAPADLFDAIDALGVRARRGGGLPALLGPICDGELITEHAHDAARAGRGADIDVLVGCTAEEATAPAALEAAKFDDDDRFRRRLGRLGLDAEQATAYAATMPDAPRWAVVGQAATDMMFRAPAALLAEGRAEGGAPAYAYEFRWRSAALGGIGAVHCVDVPFALGTLAADGVAAVTGDEPPAALGRRMHDAVVDFIVRGDPGWARYDQDVRMAMAFDETSTVLPDVWHTPRTFWPDRF